MMVAYIDEFKDRFRVGPVRGVLAASLDCGSVTPRGYRMSGSGPVSRMAARHEAPARGIPGGHADFLMAVYGYRKTRVCFCKLASTVWALFFSSIGGWFPAGTAPSEPAAPFFLVIWS